MGVVAKEHLQMETTDGKKNILVRNTWIVSVISIFVVLSVWTLLSGLHVYSALFLPSPLDVAGQFYQLTKGLYGGRDLIQQAIVSLVRVLLGFLVAVATGVPLGIWMGRSKVVEAAVNPFIQLYRPVPPLAFIPLLIVWFGIGEAPKIILIFMGTIPIIVLNTMSGVKSVQDLPIRVAISLGASKWQIMRYVLLPFSLPSIFTGMRLGIGIAWTCLVAAEMIAATSGLGWMILNASRYLSTDVIFVGILTIGFIGLIIDMILRGIERWIVPWQGKY